MPPDRTPRDTEPASGADAEDAGSVVVGLDPSEPSGVAVDTGQLAERLGEAALGFQRLRDSLARTAPAVREFGQSWEHARPSAYEFDGPVPRAAAGGGDAMRWSPPAEGEETPPCPA